ncbi:unnamed protein product [Clonostachys byssicola]|uniref:ABM domain-containing protein n=1 Tax=Clonostachys byssicola TaxID=160290 RepID=A0A9N9UGP5_9HYPO|nr:unnamed protein product [Clonostachys byssicola]
MSSIVVITHLTLVDKQARDKVAALLARVAQAARQHPGVVRYAVTIPRDNASEDSISVIEDVLERPPNATTFVTTASYSRPEVLSLADPFILIATFDYATNTRDAALDGWSTVTSACQQTQKGTLVYAVAKDPRNDDRVGSVAVYESEKYFWEVHVPGQAVVDNKAKYGDIRTKTDLAYFKLTGGFLFNDKAYSRL